METGKYSGICGDVLEDIHGSEVIKDNPDSTRLREADTGASVGACWWYPLCLLVVKLKGVSQRGLESHTSPQKPVVLVT